MKPLRTALLNLACVALIVIGVPQLLLGFSA